MVSAPDQCVLMQKVKRKAGMWAHAGMMSSARAVLQDLEAHGILQALIHGQDGNHSASSDGPSEAKDIGKFLQSKLDTKVRRDQGKAPRLVLLAEISMMASTITDWPAVAYDQGLPSHNAARCEVAMCTIKRHGVATESVMMCMIFCDCQVLIHPRWCSVLVVASTLEQVVVETTFRACFEDCLPYTHSHCHRHV